MGRFWQILTIVILVFWSSGQKVSGQRQLIDSLQLVIGNVEIPEKERIIAVSDLASMLRYTHLDYGLNLAERALGMSYDQEDTYYSGYTWYNLYLIYRKMDNPNHSVQQAVDSVIYYTDRSKMLEAQALKHYLLFLQANLKDDYSVSTSEAIQLFRLTEKTNSYKMALRACYSLTANYSILEDSVLTEKYGKLGLDYARRSADAECLALANLSMANYYELCYKLSGKEEKHYIEEAINVLRESFLLSTGNEERLTMRFVPGTAALNMAAFYFMYYPDIPVDSVLFYVNEAERWASKINDKTILSASEALMSGVLGKMGNHSEVEARLLKVWIDLESDSIVDYYRANNLMLALADNAERAGEFAKANQYRKKQQEYFVKLFDRDKYNSMNEIEALYETRQKEEKIAFLTKEKEWKNVLNLLSVGICLVLVLSIVFIYRNYRLKLSLSLKQKEVLEIENKEMELQSRLAQEKAERFELEKQEARLRAQLMEEEAARLEAEQKLIQQQNQQLQKELMVESMHLNQKNELLADLSRQINQSSQPTLQPLSMAIKQGMHLDKELTEFKNNMQNLHPDFFNRLQKKADGKLTALDLKYCAYIYMKLPVKQIANAMHVEQKTVRMTRYRIKQKLKLDKDENLDFFIENILEGEGD